jgi:hypothetical protein
MIGIHLQTVSQASSLQGELPNPLFDLFSQSHVVLTLLDNFFFTQDVSKKVKKISNSRQREYMCLPEKKIRLLVAHTGAPENLVLKTLAGQN